jgi:hypothetical protein
MIMMSFRIMQHCVWILKKPGNGFFVLRAGQDSNFHNGMSQ